MQEALHLPFGFDMHIDKGIPLGSGLGGSAASAVAAVVAANALLPTPCSKLELLKFAMHGEAVASGSMHVDNIAPVAVRRPGADRGHRQPACQADPRAAGVRAVMVHPHLFLSTKEARSILRGSVAMSDFVWQTAHLAGFISGCYTDDIELIRASLEDVVIEPQRQTLIPGFADVRRAAHGHRRAGLLDFRRRAHGLRLGAGTSGQRRAAPPCARNSRAITCRSMSGSSRSTPPVPASSGRNVMLFHSTRQPQPRPTGAGFAQALLKGLAPDGGLYVPQHWPVHQPAQLSSRIGLPPDQYLTRRAWPASGSCCSRRWCRTVSWPAVLPAITAEAFNFPAPLVPLGNEGRLGVLELFHGPTAAFKDFGARFLAACMSRLRTPGQRPLNILVATSGDTGGAVAAAFHRLPRRGISVLFPKGLVSPTQEHQLTCWGENVRASGCAARFDDCQRMVKAAFMDAQLNQRFELSSANSINLGRLLPQAVYYAAASLKGWSQHGEPVSFVVPSGNLGNAVAGLWARRLGMPIGDLVLAHNVNRTVPDLLETGSFEPRAEHSHAGLGHGRRQSQQSGATARVVPGPRRNCAHHQRRCGHDEQIRARIRTGFQEYGQIWCPHTATAAEAYARLPAAQARKGRWVLVATAHPAKFREIVEPLIGRSVPCRHRWRACLSCRRGRAEIAADLDALRQELD